MRQDQRAEFERLWRATYPRLYCYARRKTGHAEAAEDLVQEAYLRAYRGFDKYDRSKPFLNWVSRITSNLFIDGLRRASVRVGEVSLTALVLGCDCEEYDLADATANPEVIACGTTVPEPLRIALLSTSPEFRRVILLHAVGYTYSEISAELHVPMGTVRSRLCRGRREVRAALAAETPRAAPR